MLIEHYSHVRWDSSRWPNFEPWEFACPHCGEFFAAPLVFDQAQMIRKLLGAAVNINSAHRCWYWNARVGGAPLSAHKQIALDLRIGGHTPAALLRAARTAGFTSFGFYGTFLHADNRRDNRRWSTHAGRKTWNGLMMF